jgi:3-hydroxyisobutyrate dehydrogenase-like beta-hydroxyacid dehydrogenase
MGEGFTRRLLACGHRVVGYDLLPEKVAAAQSWGVEPAATPKEVAERCATIMICVTSTDAVETAVFGEDGVSRGGRADGLLVDFSTTVVENTRSMARRLKADRGMGWIDAPVSGGPDAARTGKLAIMAGGSEADISQVKPVLEELAASFTVFGPVGSGQVAKMVNQVLVLNNYVVLAEALALAEAGGIDASKIPEALAAGHAGSNLLRTNFPRMIARDYGPKGYARQVLKDLDMIHDLAKSLGTPAPMSGQAATLYRVFNSKGHEELDGVAIFKMFDPNDTI